MELKTNFKSPFLRKIFSNPKHFSRRNKYPCNIAAFSKGLNISFNHPISFVIGENGCGKSTLVEAIADKCNFNLMGGSQNHFYKDNGPQNNSALSNFISLSWSTKIRTGFFMRAESYFNFATYVDALAKDDAGILSAYGGKSLHNQSHGESFLSLFQTRLDKGIYILDEPEAALSTNRQMAFLSLIHNLVKNHQSQFIIATHSPIILSYPYATIFRLDESGISEVKYEETEQYTLTRDFLNNPMRYLKYLLEDA